MFSKCAAGNSPRGPALAACEDCNPDTALGLTPWGIQSGSLHTLGYTHYVHRKHQKEALSWTSSTAARMSLQIDGCVRGAIEALVFPPRMPINNRFSPSNPCSDTDEGLPWTCKLCGEAFASYAKTLSSSPNKHPGKQQGKKSSFTTHSEADLTLRVNHRGF